MATFTIELPDRLVPGLQAVVGRFNSNSGTDLTVQAWIDLHVREIAVSDEVAAAQQQLTQQAESDLQAALKALRERLMEGGER